MAGLLTFQRGPKWSIQVFWPFGTLLGPAGPIWAQLDPLGLCLAIIGPKWTIFGPSPLVNGGPQSKKRLITRSPMCGLHVETQNIPLGIKIWPQPMKNVKIGQNSIQKMAVNGSERSIRLILVPEMTRWNFHENRILGTAKTNLIKYPMVLLQRCLTVRTKRTLMHIW